MTLLLVLCIGLSVVFASTSLAHSFYESKQSKEKVHLFIITKGILYVALALVTLIFTFIIDGDILKVVSITSICIAVFEAIQNITQGLSERYKLECHEQLKKAEMSPLRKIELIDEFCRIKLETLKTNRSLSNKKLVREQIYDYLKYYEEAELFFKTYEEYEDGNKSLDDVFEAETILFENLKYNWIEIVKYPN